MFQIVHRDEYRARESAGLVYADLNVECSEFFAIQFQDQADSLFRLGDAGYEAKYGSMAPRSNGLVGAATWINQDYVVSAIATDLSEDVMLELPGDRKTYRRG